jgi:hypothetical protein
MNLILKMSPEDGPGVGQKNLAFQLQGHSAPGGLGHLRALKVINPIKLVVGVVLYPGPKGLRRAVPQAGKAVNGVAFKKAKQ